METSKTEKIKKSVSFVVFPLILFFFSLLKVNRGIDLTDSAYSLGNYVFFEQNQGLWTFLTYLSNVTGFLMTKLPFGSTLMGMKIYSSLLISLTALIGYRFFRTKMPEWIAFLGELAAIGLCWCPSVILYNYLTYFFLLLGMILLFRGLAGNRQICLVLAGICLGMNTFVRFPNNGLEVLLILALWYYGILKKKEFATIAKETGLCVAGYVGAFALVALVISVIYGMDTLGTMISGVFGMAGDASDYTFGEMVWAIVDAYLHGAKWMMYMIICVLPGIPFLIIRKEKFPVVRRVVYCICIGFLFFVLGRWGMYHFKYYQKEAALQWGAVFLLLSMGVCIWMMLTRMADKEWKLIGMLSFLVILITPLGSNNYIWPVLNNLFFVAPVTFWMIYRFARWGREYLDESGKVPNFPMKAMSAAIVLAFLIQSVGVGCQYVFLNGERGETLDTTIEGSRILRGIKTDAFTAETLEELNTFFMEKNSQYVGKKLILFGNIPGLSYYLGKAPAIYTTWADLDTNSYDRLVKELEELTVQMTPKTRPLVILSADIMAEGMTPEKRAAGEETDTEQTFWERKYHAILTFLSDNEYQSVFVNEKYVVFE